MIRSKVTRSLRRRGDACTAHPRLITETARRSPGRRSDSAQWQARTIYAAPHANNPRNVKKSVIRGRTAFQLQTILIIDLGSHAPARISPLRAQAGRSNHLRTLRTERETVRVWRHRPSECGSGAPRNTSARSPQTRVSCLLPVSEPSPCGDCVGGGGGGTARHGVVTHLREHRSQADPWDWTTRHVAHSGCRSGASDFTTRRRRVGRVRRRLAMVPRIPERG